MPVLTRQYFATSQQFADVVIRQITQTQADNQIVTSALQAARRLYRLPRPVRRSCMARFRTRAPRENGCASST